MTSSISARSLIITLATITALGPLSMQIYLPALPAIQDSFSVSSWQAQLVFSAPLVAIAMSSLIYGPASDRFGRRPVLLRQAPSPERNFKSRRPPTSVCDYFSFGKNGFL